MPLHDLKGWGEPIATWDYSSPQLNVDFLNLGSFRELRIVGVDLQSDTGGTDAPGLRLSTDNGMNFLDSGYENGDATQSYMTLGANSAASVKFVLDIVAINLNSATRKPVLSGIVSRVLSGINSRACTRGVGPYNALRLFWATGGANFAGGSVLLYARE